MSKVLFRFVLAAIILAPALLSADTVVEEIIARDGAFQIGRAHV